MPPCPGIYGFGGLAAPDPRRSPAPPSTTSSKPARSLRPDHADAEQKRKDGDRWDRVAGRIESLIQSQRERNRSGPDLG